MRIECPFCGERQSSEFVYLGDVGGRRPEPGRSDEQRVFYEAVYLRDNPVGVHAEFWYHVAGCRRWLEVSRDTRTHQIVGVKFATGERVQT